MGKYNNFPSSVNILSSVYRVFLSRKLSLFYNFRKNEREQYVYEMADYSIMKIYNEHVTSIFRIYRFIPFW